MSIHDFSLTAPTSIANWQCSDCNSFFSSLVAPEICALCEEYPTLHMNVTCDDCWLSYESSTYDLIISLNPFALNMNIDLFMEASLNIEATVDTDFAYTDAMITTLFNNLFPNTAFTFSVGFGINFQIGLVLSLSLTTNVTMEAVSQFQGGASADLQLTASLGYVLGSGPYVNTPPPILSWQPHPSTFAGQGHVDLQFGLLPNLSFSFLYIFDASIGIEGYADLTAEYSIPAYPAITLPNYYQRNPYSSFPINIGSCTSPHYIQYQLAVGLRNNRIIVQFDINLFGWNIAQNYFALDNFLYLTQLQPLISGCLISAPSSAVEPASTSAFIYLTLNNTVNLNVLINQQSLLMDVANAVAQPLVRFYLVSSQSSQYVNGTNVTIVVFSSNDATQPTSAVIASNIAQQLTNSNSALRTGHITRNVVNPIISTTNNDNVSGQTENTSSSISIGIIGGVAGGVAALIAIIAAVVYYSMVSRRIHPVNTEPKTIKTLSGLQLVPLNANLRVAPVPSITAIAPPQQMPSHLNNPPEYTAVTQFIAHPNEIDTCRPNNTIESEMCV